MTMTVYGAYGGNSSRKRARRMPCIERSRPAEGYGLGSWSPKSQLAVSATASGKLPGRLCFSDLASVTLQWLVAPAHTGAEEQAQDSHPRFSGKGFVSLFYPENCPTNGVRLSP